MHAEEVIGRHVDDEIGALVYSMIGEPSVEAQLRHHLALSQKSVYILHTQLKGLQHKHEGLEARYTGAKEEASMTATALRQKIGEFDTLKESFDQLSKECELFRNDREIFAEAADDAEERRAEADKQAAQAELRVVEAELREKAAISFIENVLKGQHGDKSQAFSSPEIKARWAAIVGTEITELSSGSKSQTSISKGDGKLNDSCRPSKSTASKKTQVRRVETAGQSSMSMLSKDARGTKRVLFEACKAREEIRNVVQRRASKIVLMDRKKFSGTIHKANTLQARKSNEKENVDVDLEAEAQAKIEEAAHSDSETTRYLADLLVILKRNLVKAEAEGDLIYTKYCEIHKLLMDTLETFGILPEVSEGRAHPDDALTIKST